MAMIWKINTPLQQDLYPRAFVGGATTDGVATPSFAAATTTAASAVITGVTTTSAFAASSMVYVDGATSKYSHIITSLVTNTSLTLFDSTSAVNDTVTVYNVQAQIIYVPIVPKRIVWRDTTNGITWSWSISMPWGTCEKYVWATGITTRVSAFDITVRPNSFVVSPTAAPVSSVFEFEVS